MAGLKPNDFFWIIEGKLAVSECIGGGGLTARKIRREFKKQEKIFSIEFKETEDTKVEETKEKEALSGSLTF